ncbi:hypothetical protein A2617_01925 [Candidatus Daviesbacteria bacterium RIFOXYD1_FULL_41_10]|uniref:Orotate phosphoribosyltransferase n=2 Tax=Candidatus Daviesiibacteriota TaxID=1752718 RepID=A0A1F5N105_9BACT|nr:MAG: Orotate phosphoribosyltransferase [Candidatus Daviesbacteria bacterium GW2011_GWB1_41_5]OGE71262.1 MAG: hypothetical protein A2617_01925 [Candidatus Daviesbacteria bacterium RIFOXYD1_FULL_41_10]
MASPDYVAELILKPASDGRSCLCLSEKPPYRVSSGGYQPLYVDLRRFQSMPCQIEELTVLFHHKIVKLLTGEPGIHSDFSLYAIAATKSGGIVPADRIAQKMVIPMITVSPKPKEHGLTGSIAGILEEGKNYLALDDITRTGGSVVKVIEAIRREDGIVTDALSVLDYGWPETARKFKEIDVTPHCLVDLPTLIAAAIRKGLINQHMASVIEEWQKDPWAWSEKQTVYGQVDGL